MLDKLSEVKVGGIYQNGIVFHLAENNALVAQPRDYPSRKSWHNAFEAAQSYGEGWRLPTKDELNLLYQQQNIVGGFTSDDNRYWSSTEFDTDNAWRQYFGSGYQNYHYKDLSFLVRAIKEVRI